MFIWRGHGIMVFIFILFGMGGAVGLSTILTNDAKYYVTHPWVEPLGMFIAATAIYLFDRLLHKEKPRVVIDKGTGKEITLTQPHDLFYIPFKAWPYICLALAVLFFWQRWH